MPKNKVLELLLSSKGEFISGERISKMLGVSRAAICKDIKLIRADGYTIDAVTNKGYMLVNEAEALNLVSIRSQLHSDNYKDNILVLNSIDSTSTYAKHLAMEGAASGTVIIARQQTAGRGRKGKNFTSPKDTGLYMSIILRPDVAPNKVVTLTAFAAVAICEAIFKVCGKRPDIKWINDLIMNKKKIAGILTELSFESETMTIDYLVLGIGINVYSEPASTDSTLKNIATSIEAATGKHISLNQLAAQIIDELDSMVEAWKTKSEKYKEIFEKQCISLNSKVLVGTEAKPGTAIGIDDHYGLIVRYENNSTEVITSGSVHVLGYCGY